MGQQLVDLAELAQFLRGAVEAKQPLRVTASLQELGHVGAHQVGTLVAGSSQEGVDRAQVTYSSCALLGVGTPWRETS